MYNENMKKDSKKDMNNKKSENPNHKHEIPRLNRAIGQLEGIKKMIEERRYCPDILTQMRAVRSALRSVEANILERHLQHCVAAAFGSEEERRKKIAELKELFNRFES